MNTAKRSVQKILRRAGIYQRLKSSPLYDLYWRFSDRSWITHRTRQVAFYRQLLVGYQKGDLIFDVGANVGDKTDVFLRLGARVVAVEPDKSNQEILREKFLKFRLAPKPVVIVGKAVSDSAKVETMYVDGPGSALNTLNPKWVDVLKGNKKRFEQTQDRLDFEGHMEVQTTTLEQLIAAYGTPFFVKIDVEGYEKWALLGLKRTVPFLSYEVNLPEFLSEGLECVKLLEGLDKDGRFNYAADFRDGLQLDTWLDARAFAQVLDQCRETNLEVFWTTLKSPEL
jgi:FkbM family methyltransferase